MPPGHLTVKSNLFNMAAVSVKRSILTFVNFHNKSPLNKLLCPKLKVESVFLWLNVFLSRSMFLRL